MKLLYVDNYVIETPILDILNRLKAELTNGKLKDIKPHTDDIVVTCPNRYHDDGHEHNPDCNIYIGNPKEGVPYGFFRCFACDFKGPFVKFVQECFESSEDYAKQWLINNFGVKAHEKILLDDDIIIGKKYKNKKYFIDESILDNYQTWCPYMAKRKLSRATCEKFKLRYDPKARQIIFPAYDRNGNLVMLPTRSIDYKTFYLNKEQEKPVYCLNYIIKNNIKKAIITEGPFDTLTCYEYGFPAIGTLGTISDEQIKQINNSCITTLLLMFDNDEAGTRFAQYVRDKLDKRIITEYVRIPKPYKDINDLSKEEFDKLIEKFRN